MAKIPETLSYDDVLLSVSGDTDAHEKIRKITLECEKSGSRLVDALQKDPLAL